jgi:Ca2+-binding RTX toxin-like protein
VKRRTIKELLKGSVISLVSAVLVASVAAACTSIAIAHEESSQPRFSISNTISSSAIQQTPAFLYPGVQRYLWYTAHNPLKVPITVRTMSISTVTPPPGCPTLNLDYAATNFTGTLVVPAQGSNSVPVPISLFETHSNQDSCKNKVFAFVFQGSATYGIVASTQTQVSSSHNPSVVGQSVTYTAAVISSDGSGNQQNLGSPTGAVTFYDGYTIICSDVPLTSDNGTSQATCTSPAYVVPGVHPITAAFANADGNFSDSTSSVLDQVIQSRKSFTVLASWPNPSVVGFPVVLTANVFATPSVPSGPTPSGTVTFYLGLPNGPHSVIGTESLDATGKAVLTTSALLAGSDDLFEVYNGDANFPSSTSAVIIQVVIAKPGHCDDHYDNWFYGSPGSPSIQGTSGNNFFWVPVGSFDVHGSDGDNCFKGGDSDDSFSSGNGHDDITSGNGNNKISAGNGIDDVQVGDGSNEITLGNGNDTVAVGNGSRNRVTVGSGNDTLTFGSGSSNQVTLGSGADVVMLGGSQNTITDTSGSVTVYLSGAGNSFTGSAHHGDVCHLPTPPSSWHGSPVAYYHDILTNCTVVSP